MAEKKGFRHSLGAEDVVMEDVMVIAGDAVPGLIKDIDYTDNSNLIEVRDYIEPKFSWDKKQILLKKTVKHDTTNDKENYEEDLLVIYTPTTIDKN